MKQRKAGSSSAVFSYEERRRGLFKLRSEAGISQRDIGRLSGVNSETICRYERGLRDLKPKKVETIENALADIIAGRKAGEELTARLHAERAQVGAVGVMADLNPPKKGTAEYTEWRDRAIRQHERGTRELTEKVRQLTAINAERVHVIAILREQKNQSGRDRDLTRRSHQIVPRGISRAARRSGFSATTGEIIGQKVGERAVSLILTSTTDTPEAVNAAAEMHEGDQVVVPAEGGDAQPSRGEEAINRTKNVAAVGEPPEATEATQREIDEVKQQRSDEYMGRTRRRLVHQVQRQSEQIEELQARLAQYESQQPAENNGADEPQAAAHEPQQQQQQQPVNAEEAFRQQWNAAQQRLPELVKEAKTRIPDLDEALQKADKENPVSATAYLHITTLPNAPDVAYHLATHPGKIARLWQLEASGRGDLMLAELNRISAGLEFNANHGGTARAPAARRQSTAPAPIRPVGTSVSRETAGEAPKDFQAYKAWYQRKYGSR
jgi:transcriptional regulator with XRE-family HTH domain